MGMATATSQSTATTALGTALFRFRSFTPVPIIAAVAWLLWRSRGAPGPGGPAVDAWLNAVGLAVAAAGQALRFYTLSLVREGSSGQGAVLESTHLNTQGPYAHVRNPLYVGNLGIVLGLLLMAHDPWAYAVTLGFFFGEYHFIIRAEERFLLEQHGDAYRDFLARVPRCRKRQRRRSGHHAPAELPPTLYFGRHVPKVTVAPGDRQRDLEDAFAYAIVSALLGR